MNKVYIILKEENWFYDEFYDGKYASLNVFDTIESARNYFKVYIEAILDELEENYGDDDFYEMIEIDKYDEDIISIEMEDNYYIRISIKEYNVMSMN